MAIHIQHVQEGLAPAIVQAEQQVAHAQMEPAIYIVPKEHVQIVPSKDVG